MKFLQDLLLISFYQSLNIWLISLKFLQMQAKVKKESLKFQKESKINLCYQLLYFFATFFPKTFPSLGKKKSKHEINNYSMVSLTTKFTLGSFPISSSFATLKVLFNSKALIQTNKENKWTRTKKRQLAFVTLILSSTSLLEQIAPFWSNW